MKMTVICYKTKEPVIYSKGTQYEKKEDTFLSYYTYKTVEKAQEEVKALNENKPAKLWNGERIDWTKIDYFFVSEQEEM